MLLPSACCCFLRFLLLPATPCLSNDGIVVRMQACKVAWGMSGETVGEVSWRVLGMASAGGAIGF